MRLKGKVAIISGAGSGMGAAEGRLFAAEGAKVMLTDVNEASVKAVAAEIGDNAIWMRHDVSDEAGWAEVAKKTLDAFGRIDVLVNNAGINCDGKIQDIDTALMQRSLNVNLMGAFYGMRAVIEPMRKVGGGSIVNISSGLATTSLPGFVAYGVAKWGIRGLTRLSARDLAEYNIRVNTLFPGAIETPMLVPSVRENAPTMMPLKRIGAAEEFAQVALFVASGDASYVSGAEIMVDGALLC